MRLCLFLFVALCQESAAFNWWKPWTWFRKEKSPTSPNLILSDPVDDNYQAAWEATRNMLSADPDSQCEIVPAIGKDTLTEQMCKDTFVGRPEGNIQTTSSSIIFGVLTNLQKAAVAKYTNNCVAIVLNERCAKSGCDQRLSDDELLDEFKMLNAVKELKILPEVYYLSPPVTLTEFSKDKVLSAALKDTATRSECVRRNTKVRMMIQAKVGCDMFDFHNKYIMPGLKKPELRLKVLKFIVQIGLQLIELLQKLHDAGIIHADIHEGNAAFGTDIPTNFDWTLNKVVLLDLGMARFYPGDINLPEDQKRRLGPPADLLSPWNIANYRVGRRDDLYRAMELVSNLMTGRPLPENFEKNPGQIKTGIFSTRLKKMYKRNELSREEYFLAINKMNANLFQADKRIKKSSALNNFKLDTSQEEKIGHLLDQVITQIRLIPSVGERPKYDEYITAMIEVLQVIDDAGSRSLGTSLGTSKIQPHQ